MPLNELSYAIDHTVLPRLQSLIKRVCDASPEARALVEQELLAAPATVIDLTDEQDQRTQTTTGIKRQRYAMCEQCKEEFDVTENDEESCQYHPGDLEVDWESGQWDDHDEKCHGTIDLGLADEYPAGFQWTCCDETGEELGCAVGPHKADGHFKPESKKRRIWE